MKNNRNFGRPKRQHIEDYRLYIGDVLGCLTKRYELVDTIRATNH